MTRSRLTFVAVAVLGLAACADSTTPSMIADSDITSDVAASSGDAIATAIETLTGNQLTGALPYATNAGDPTANDVVVQRTRTCFDAAGATIACNPVSSVRKIVTHVAIDGSRSGTHVNDRGTVTFTGAVHRVMDDTLSRVFNTAQPPVETSRVHTAISSGNDTSTFTGETFSRVANEAFVDSVKAITFNLPRSSNPWPVSGSIVRNVSVDVTMTSENRTGSRSATRRIQVTFPADAQGNVVLTINDKTCNLNLVTHRVTNCQ